MPAIGILFALLSSANFGLTGATIRRGMVGITALQGLYITIFTGLPMFFVAAVATGELFRWREFTQSDYVLLLVAGVVQLGVGRYANYRAIAALGANRAAPVVGMSTLVSIAVAVVFLAEVVTVTMGIGIAMMMIGPTLVTPRRRAESVPGRPAGGSGTGPAEAPASVSASVTAAIAVARDPRVLEGFAFGALASAAWGVAPVLMRAAVDESGLGVLGGLVNYVATASVLLILLAMPGQLAAMRRLDRSGSRWFLFTAANSFLANLFRFMALAIAPVTIVVPLLRISNVFSLFFSFLLNRSMESFDPRVILGIVVSGVGAALLVL